MGNLRLLRSAIVALLGLLPTTALAQSSEDALLTECYSLRRAGRAAESLAPCERAVALAPSGRTLGQLALSEMALERWSDAARHLDAALRDSHPWVQQNRAQLLEAMRVTRSHVGELRVEASVSGATARVAGGAEVALPTTVFLAPGATSIALRAPDGRTLTREVVITAGATSRESFVFGEATTRQSATGDLNVTPHPPTRQASSTRRALAWAAAGTAVAGFGMALVTWRIREGVANDTPDECRVATTSDQALVDRCTAWNNNAQSQLDTWDALSVVGLVAGGALAVTSVVLFATEPRGSSRATTLSCGAGPGTLGARCAINF